MYSILKYRVILFRLPYIWSPCQVLAGKDKIFAAILRFIADPASSGRPLEGFNSRSNSGFSISNPKSAEPDYYIIDPLHL
jgi:hypothetical protein